MLGVSLRPGKRPAIKLEVSFLFYLEIKIRYWCLKIREWNKMKKIKEIEQV